MFWASVILLILGGVLLGLSLPFSSPPHGLLDFSELFWYGQWAGFWILMASLILLGFDWLQSPARYGPGWRPAMLAPAIAVLLCLSFVVFSIPEYSNRGRWASGEIGLLPYLRAKRRKFQDAKTVRSLAAQFEGPWVSDSGERLQIDSKECKAWFSTEYRLIDKRDLGWYFSGTTRGIWARWETLPDTQYPLLTVGCNDRRMVYAILREDQLMRYEESGEARRLDLFSRPR